MALASKTNELKPLIEASDSSHINGLRAVLDKILSILSINTTKGKSKVKFDDHTQLYVDGRDGPDGEVICVGTYAADPKRGPVSYDDLCEVYKGRNNEQNMPNDNFGTKWKDVTDNKDPYTGNWLSIEYIRGLFFSEKAPVVKSILKEPKDCKYGLKADQVATVAKEPQQLTAEEQEKEDIIDNENNNLRAYEQEQGLALGTLLRA